MMPIVSTPSIFWIYWRLVAKAFYWKVTVFAIVGQPARDFALSADKTEMRILVRVRKILSTYVGQV